MKKFLALSLVLCMLACALMGCVVIKDDVDLSNGDTNTGNHFDDTSYNNTDDDSGSNGNSGNEKITVTLEETVVYNENDIVVTATGLDEGFMGQEVKLRVENNSDKNITLSGSTFIVNGVTVSGNMYIAVAAGKKTNDSILLYTADFERAGIEHIATVSTYDANIIDSDTYKSICDVTLDIRTSIADTYEQVIDESGDALFQQDGVTVIAKELEDSLLGKTVVLLVKNETGKNILVSAENVSVNGYTVTSFAYNTVCKDTYNYATIELLSSELEENEIDVIEEVTFSLKVTDKDTYKKITESGELKVVTNN